MQDLANLLEHEDEVRGEVVGAVAYPGFVLCFGIVTITVLLTDNWAARDTAGESPQGDYGFERVAEFLEPRQRQRRAEQRRPWRFRRDARGLRQRADRPVPPVPAPGGSADRAAARRSRSFPSAHPRHGTPSDSDRRRGRSRCRSAARRRWSSQRRLSRAASSLTAFKRA